MRNISFALLLLLSCMLSFGQTPLPNDWKFKQVDDAAFSAPGFDDSHWDVQPVGKSWTAGKNDKNVIVWYRVKVKIPSSQRAAMIDGRGLKLHLGKIDDADETYFNGKLIGKTGSFPPAYDGKWDTERSYIIPADAVKWDEENQIAVRVFSPDPGGVGMYIGPYAIGAVQWSDFISVDQQILETPDHGWSARLLLRNHGNISFSGKAYYIVSKVGNTDSNLYLMKDSAHVNIQKDRDSMTVIDFRTVHPVADTLCRFTWFVSTDQLNATLWHNEVHLLKRNINLPVEKQPVPVVANAIPDAFSSAAYEKIMLDGYLGKRADQNLEERLLKVDEEGIISGYLNRPGSHPWIGEHVGKFLETACNTWRYTHDERLKVMMDRLVVELIASQKEDGYLGTYTPHDYWTSWDVWSHKYNLYGLLAYYGTTGYQPALNACKRMGDLLCRTFGNGKDQRDIIKAGEHMGMAATSVLDPMLMLYRFSGEKRYLDFCYYILSAWEQSNGPKIISSLLQYKQVNKVANGKAYEMLSNLLGLVDFYRLTGDRKLLEPVLIAWEDIIKNRLYITGTTSSFEHFQDDGQLPATANDNIGEGCVTTTWIQFNKALLDITGDMKFAAQIERSVYNHLLAAENPQTGCVSYYTSLMDAKPFNCGITCCTSSVPRGIAFIPSFGAGMYQNDPVLLNYEAAHYGMVVDNHDNPVEMILKVTGDFPAAGNLLVTVVLAHPATFTLRLRVPEWCTGYTAALMGKMYKGVPGQLLEISRRWNNGDKIQVRFNMPLQQIPGGISYPGLFANQRGPQVLAMDQSLNVINDKPVTQTEMLTLVPSGEFNPVFKFPGKWIGKQAYTFAILKGRAGSKPAATRLVPFADAGQTGAPLKVWLPFQLKLK